jgi:protein subunit release factor B
MILCSALIVKNDYIAMIKKCGLCDVVSQSPFAKIALTHNSAPSSDHRHDASMDKHNIYIVSHDLLIMSVSHLLSV